MLDSAKVAVFSNDKAALSSLKAVVVRVGTPHVFEIEELIFDPQALRSFLKI